jgi:phenylalanine-4-hydroxylase
LTDKPQFKDFNPEKIAETEYPITKYQPVYFVAESFESAKEKVR